MKQFLKRKSTNLAVLIICIASFGLIGQGCQKEDENFNKESEITTSIELENYIIAASDFHQSLKIFRNELAKIDFSKLETVIENGRKVTYLPTSVRSLSFEKEALLMNQKKEHLLNKYPQVSSRDFTAFTKVVNHCIQQSTRINDFFLDKNIYFNQPLTRVVVGEWSFDHPNALLSHLYSWVLDPDYVEVVIYFFTDGTNLVTLNSDNLSYRSYPILAPHPDGSCYYQGKEITKIGHTHRQSSDPSDRDYAFRDKYPGIEHSIYYNYGFWTY